MTAGENQIGKTVGAAAIRPAQNNDDFRICADIWLEASIMAHDFIPEQFWRDRYSLMAETFLPASTVYLAAQGNEPPSAFAAVSGSRLEALFVRPGRQRAGLGRALLHHVLQNHGKITLSAYQKNQGAMAFYQNEGFRIIGQDVCAHSGEKEFVMSTSGGRGKDMD